MGFHISEPSDEDLDKLEHVDITSNTPWLPQTIVDDHDATDLLEQKVSSYATDDRDLSTLTPSYMQTASIGGCKGSLRHEGEP